LRNPTTHHRLLRRSTTRPEDRSATNEPKELPSPHVPPALTLAHRSGSNE